MGYPPLVVVRVARAHGRARGLAELGGVGPFAQLGNGGGRDDLLAVEAAVGSQHLAQTAQVTQSGVHAHAGGLAAIGVGKHIRVLLRAQLGPDALGQQRGVALARHALQQPAQHFRVHRLVGKCGAVLAVLLHSGQVLGHALGPIAAGARRLQARSGQVLKDTGGGVRKVFGVFDAGGHVQGLLHGGIGPGAVGQLGQVTHDARTGVDGAFLDELRHQQPHQRFAHGPQHMRLLRLHADVIALVRHTAPVQHEHGVGVRGLLPIGQRGGGALVVGKRQGVGQGARRGGQCAGRCCTPPDGSRGPQFAQVLRGPAHVGVLEDVGQPHDLVGCRGEALHQLQGHRVGGVRRWQLLSLGLTVRSGPQQGAGQGDGGEGRGEVAMKRAHGEKTSVKKRGMGKNKKGHGIGRADQPRAASKVRITPSVRSYSPSPKCL